MIPCIETIELIALAGFDAVILDQEHGPLDIAVLRMLTIAAVARGVHCIVRVRENEPSLIGAALDVGADGILVPQIANAEDARRAVSAARFAPAGHRGANPWVRAANFAGGPGWYEAANAQVAVLVMIEGTEGAAAARDILAVEGLDGVFLGPVDFSHSLGVPGEVDHPLVVGEFETIIRLAAQSGIACSVFASTAQLSNKWIENGARMVAFGCDIQHIGAGLKAARSLLKPS